MEKGQQIKHPPVSTNTLSGHRETEARTEVDITGRGGVQTVTDDRRNEPRNQQGFVRKGSLVNKESPQRFAAELNNLILAKGRAERESSHKRQKMMVLVISVRLLT